MALAAAMVLPPYAAAAHYTIVIAGLGGTAEYAERFVSQADAVEEAARRGADDPSHVVVLKGDEATRDAIKQRFAQLAEQMAASDTVAVHLIGHGSYDGDAYKLNLPGPDLDGAGFAELLAALPARSQLVVNATSASGAVLEPWAAENRILVTATRSGVERNATRFAEYWALAMFSDAADVNKNGIVTAREAFDYTSRRVAESYEDDGTLATEHPQITGEGADRFAVARLAARASATPAQERLLGERDRLEQEIAELRARRAGMGNEAYLDALQALLLQLALVQRELDAQPGTEGTPTPADAPPQTP